MTEVGPTAADRDLSAIEARRARIRERYLQPADQRPASTARGLHHTALISADVERTVRFYQDLLGFPLTELIDNRDYPGSSHFFFDIGNSNLLAFFDFPGLDVGPYAEVLGGLHHLAISVEPSRWQAIIDRFDEAGLDYVSTAASRSTSPTPTARASNSSPIRSARCTARRSSADPARHRPFGDLGAACASPTEKPMSNGPRIKRESARRPAHGLSDLQATKRRVGRSARRRQVGAMIKDFENGDGPELGAPSLIRPIGEPSRSPGPRPGTARGWGRRSSVG